MGYSFIMETAGQCKKVSVGKTKIRYLELEKTMQVLPGSPYLIGHQVARILQARPGRSGKQEQE